MDEPPPSPLAELYSRWPLDGGHLVRDAVLAAYADPERGYHDVTHLLEVLRRIDELRQAGQEFDELPVVLAAWFHDSVYDGERDSEERSAVWAEEALPALVEESVVIEVARLVRLTEEHRPEARDLNGCVLSDADLAILAAPTERYADYVAAVRSEFDHLDDDVFCAGRVEVLAGLADKPEFFHTALGRAQWESRARDNVAAELSRLRLLCA